MSDDEEVLVPSADLLESMRAVGYSLETAVADLIDNSLAANAKNIWVNFESNPELYVSITDDGRGMDKDTLRTAMKLAGRSPVSAREKDDLGRFGLGLKTASLSQCRNLTVATKSAKADTFVASWDLDYISQKKDWVLRWLDVRVLEYLPSFERFHQSKSGTQVIWRNLDLLLSTPAVDSDEFSELKESVAKHLSLVFHRYMQLVGNQKVRIYLNNSELKPMDPFLESAPGTQIKDEISIRIGESTVTAKPFILPDQNKLTKAQRDQALIGETMRETQGFYIYRNKRLLSWGTWFRMTGKSELSKLARVRVDTPNSLDKEWRLGIMKSSVQPPKVLRDRLRSIVPRIVGDSQRVTRGRNVLALGAQGSTWKIIELGDGAFSLNLNLDYPIIRALDESLNASQRKQLIALFDAIETQFPFNEIHDRLTSDNAVTEEKSEFPVRELYLALLSLNADPEVAFVELLRTPPISTTPGMRADIERRKSEFIELARGEKA